MPNYYYVRNNGSTFIGTATGDGGRATSQRTGAWNTTASQSYASVLAALGATTPPANGDFIVVGNDHSYNYGANQTLTSTVTTRTRGTLNLISVSITNQDQYSIGAEEKTTGSNTYTFTFTGPWSLFGMTLTAANNVAHGNDTDLFSYECKYQITAATSGRNISFNSQTGSGTFINCTFDPVDSNTTLNFAAGQGSTVSLYGCTLLGNCTVGLISNASTSRGTTWHFEGCDFSGVGTAGTDYILESAFGQAGEDLLQVTLKRCRINGTVGGWTSTDPLALNSFLKVTNSSSTSAGSEYQFAHVTSSGDAEATTSTYRNQSVAWPVSGSKTSIAIDVVTLGTAVPGRPYILDLPSRYAELSASATDKITIYLSGQSGLTDKQVFVELIYPDGTNAYIPNQIFSSSSPFNPFATGTALTSDTGSSWTSGGAANYRIEIDVTAVDPGADCVPIIRLYVQGLSSTLYVDSQVDLS